MKEIKTILFFIPLLLSCSGNTHAGESAGNEDTMTSQNISTNTPVSPDSFPTGQVINNIACKNDASLSYALYIPKTNEKMLPVIYFFDPHAGGSLPLKKYAALADKFHFILIGSNNSKNGNDWLTTDHIWNILFDDIKARVMIDVNRVYVCGFSGGAKVASYLALRNTNIKNVIACGAALPDGTPAGNFDFSFTGIAGKGDMNMTDLIATDNAFDKTQTLHRLILFDGKHEWPPESVMNTAFAGLQLDAMRNGLIKKDDAFINAQMADLKTQVENFLKQNSLTDAAKLCDLAAHLFNGISADTLWFNERKKTLLSDPAFQKQNQLEQSLFSKEQNIKADFMNHFQQADKNYWVNTISSLNEKAKAHTPEAAMNQRLLAYLSLAFYSFSNRAINSSMNDDADYFVDLYKIADPTNSEAWYFSAIMNARHGNAKATESDLNKAIDNGFNDKARMMQQQEFQSIASQMNMQSLENKMNSMQ